MTRRNPWTGQQMQNCGVCSECLAEAEHANLQTDYHEALAEAERLQTENNRLRRWLQRIEASTATPPQLLAQRALKGDLP